MEESIQISEQEKNMRGSIEAYAIAKASENALLVNMSLMYLNELFQRYEIVERPDKTVYPVSENSDGI